MKVVVVRLRRYCALGESVPTTRMAMEIVLAVLVTPQETKSVLGNVESPIGSQSSRTTTVSDPRRPSASMTFTLAVTRKSVPG